MAAADTAGMLENEPHPVTRLLAALLSSALLACASTGRAERIAKLSPESSQLYARYRQFMTEKQGDLFLEAQTDLERKQQIDDLKIDEMLSQFPKPVQDAIWGQQITMGMSRAAVLLSWGGPYQREFDEFALTRGNEVETWWYTRGGNTARVVFTNGLVTDWDDGKK